MAVLTHGPPEVVSLATDREEHLVEMPLITGAWAPPPELVGVLLAKFPAPLPDGFIRDDDPPGEQEFFHIPVAQAEAEVQPDRVADDLDGKAVVLITVDGRCVHVPSMAHQASARQAIEQVDNAS